VPDKSGPLASDVPLPDPTAKPAETPLDRQIGEAFPRLVAVMRRLLAPGGCPWDRSQTPDTLKRYVLEEACEVIDAIESKDSGHLREELGDLLLQVVFQAELARRDGTFGPDDVVEGIVEKLVRRHPHVFGDAAAKDAVEVLKNWEQIKAQEKGNRGLIEGVPRALPALVRAQRVGEKVARVGFDWPSIEGPRAKVGEELAELDAALASGDLGKVEEELGDVLFSLVNLARHVKTPDSGGIDAEGALRRTIDKFVRRFGHVEQRVRDEHGGFGSRPSLETLDAYWNEAKASD
jgi:tetrapyrrole methylase family protein/MazG family protein/ATP diphosphatase